MRTKRLSLILVGSLLVLLPACQGENLVSFQFGGSVSLLDDFNDLLGGAISVGDPVSGVFRYDLNTGDSDPSPYGGLYVHTAPPAGISVETKGFVFRTDPVNVDFQVEVDSFIGHPADTLILSSWKNIIPILESGILEGSLLHVSLSDLTHGALEGDALPAELHLEDWTSAFGTIRIDAGGNGDVFLQFSIDTLEPYAGGGKW